MHNFRLGFNEKGLQNSQAEKENDFEKVKTSDLSESIVREGFFK
jgi:hypothetical protein